MSEAARRGFTVMRPISWGSVYDILLGDEGEGFRRVQVKSSGRPRDPRWRRGKRGELYIFDTRRRDGAYRAADLDFYALYIIPRDTWYIIPFEAIGPVEVLCVYPDNPRHRLEEYREAWHLLRKEKVVEKLRDAREMKARARKKIVVVEEG